MPGETSDGEPTRGWRVPAVLMAGVALVVAAAVVLLALGDDRADPFDRARRLAADPSGFDSGAESAGTLARVAQHLNDAVAECRADGSAPVRCQGISAASGYVQVLAGTVLTCTAPGRFEARTRVVSLLDEVAELDATSDDLPEPPPLPIC